MSEIELSRMKAEARKINENAEIAYKKQKQDAELEKDKRARELEIKRAQEFSNLESGKFQKVVDAIG